MTKIRHGAQALHPVPREGARGFSGAALALPAALAQQIAPQVLVADNAPIVWDHPVSVSLLSFEPSGTIDEHDADQDTLVIIIEGSGFVRVGGPDAPEMPVSAGDAVLWPSHVLHLAWTTDQPMRAITVEFSPA